MTPTIEKIRARWEAADGISYHTNGYDDSGAYIDYTDAAEDFDALLAEVEYHQKFARLVLASTDLGELQQAAKALLKGE